MSIRSKSASSLYSLMAAQAGACDVEPSQQLIQRLLSVYKPDYRYSEHVAAFWMGCARLGLLDLDGDGVAIPEMHLSGWQGAETFHQLVTMLQEEACSPIFKRACHDRQYELRQKQQAIKDYTRHLLAYYSRLQIVRLDLGYRRDKQRFITIDDVYFHLEYLNRLRYTDSVFDPMVGSIWCIEQGKERGYHIHLAYFFSGSQVQNAWYKGECIRERWISITSGLGTSHNCNGDEKRYPRRGIGLIHRNNEEECERAVEAMVYLSEPDKDDQYLRMKPEGRRTFGTGAPPSFELKRGRPPIRI
jgi:hypothetical protein